MFAGIQAIAEEKSYASKDELNNPISWLAINSYDIAVLYNIFFASHEDPNDKTVKIATLKQERIDDGIPFATLAYAKMAYSKQVNEVLAFFNEADKPTRALITLFINVSYNRDKVYRMLGGIVGILCLGVIVNKLQSRIFPVTVFKPTKPTTTTD
jgi:hypothetical protein